MCISCAHDCRIIVVTIVHTQTHTQGEERRLICIYLDCFRWLSLFRNQGERNKNRKIDTLKHSARWWRLVVDGGLLCMKGLKPTETHSITRVHTRTNYMHRRAQMHTDTHSHSLRNQRYRLVAVICVASHRIDTYTLNLHAHTTIYRLRSDECNVNRI